MDDCLYTCAMTAHTLVSGEGPRARSVLDMLARAAGVASGQALLCHLESLGNDGMALIGESIAATLPSSKPVDELAAAAA